MASVQPSGSGFRVFYTRDGRRLASPQQASQAAAEAWMAEHLPTLAAKHVFDLLRVWRNEAPSAHRDEVERRLSEAARKRGWNTVESLDLAELRAWQRAAPCARYGQYLVTILRWASEVHHLRIRPDALAWRPDSYRRLAPVPLLTDAQAAGIRAASLKYGPRAEAVVDYLLTYGARPITACMLMRSDLDIPRGELVIRGAKHSGGWRHAVTDAHLAAWPKLSNAEDGPLFPHPQEDRPWRIKRGSARELCDWYRNTIAKKLRLGRMGGIYHLKRYAITTMLRKGIDPATVALFTGHLDLQQVLRYAKSNVDLQRSALALLGGNTDRNAVTQPPAVTH